MPKGLGRQIQVGLAKEAVRGTAETAATYYIPFTEAAVEEKNDLLANEQAMGVLEDTTEAKSVSVSAEVNIKGAVGDKTFPLLLLASLGSVASASEIAPNTAVYDHTFTVNQSVQHQSLTIFLNDPLSVVDYKHALGCVDSLDLAYEQNKFVEFDAKLKALKGTVATLTPATTAENLFLPQHFVFKLASSVAGLTAATAIPVKSFKLKISKALEADTVLGNIAPVDFLCKKISIEGEVEAVWQNEDDFKTAFMAGTVQAMRIDLKSDVIIGTSANPQITIDLSKVIFNDLTHPIKVGDVMRQTIQFKAMYDTTTSKMVSIKVSNLVTSY